MYFLKICLRIWCYSWFDGKWWWCSMIFGMMGLFDIHADAQTTDIHTHANTIVGEKIGEWITLTCYLKKKKSSQHKSPALYQYHDIVVYSSKKIMVFGTIVGQNFK